RPRSLHLPLLFPLTAPPPRSTLFPYTTLFRSHALVRIGLAALERRPGGREPHRTQAQLLARQRRGHHREHQRAAPTEACSLTGQRAGGRVGCAELGDPYRLLLRGIPRRLADIPDEFAVLRFVRVLPAPDLTDDLALLLRQHLHVDHAEAVATHVAIPHPLDAHMPRIGGGEIHAFVHQPAERGRVRLVLRAEERI